MQDNFDYTQKPSKNAKHLIKSLKKSSDPYERCIARVEKSMLKFKTYSRSAREHEWINTYYYFCHGHNY